MNEQLENAVVTLINKSVEGVESSINFLQAEIPEVVYQLLMWNAVSSLVTGVISLIVTLLWFYWGIYTPFKIIQKGRKEKIKTMFTYSDGDLKGNLGHLIFNIFVVIPFLVTTSNLMEALKIWIAPKVWLLEYAASLVK